MKLRIWHIINIPGEIFRFNVPDVETAIRALKAIALYDLFLGDGTDKAMTTVGQRRRKRQELARKDRHLFLLFAAYNNYQLKRCPGGVPLVNSNAQGLEVFDETEDDWFEYYDEAGKDIEELAEEAEEKAKIATAQAEVKA